KLRPFLEQWRGRDFTPEELQGFNLAKLKGANCLLTVQHKDTDKGDTWANVVAAEPYKNGSSSVVSDPEKLLKPEDYTRRDYSKKRENSQAQAAAVNGNATEKTDWVPF